MILGIGSDLVQIDRVQQSINRFGDAFLNRIFSPAEQALTQEMNAQQKINFYARRFAAKEAVSKALGTGIGAYASFTDIEILKDSFGAPVAFLTGKALDTLLQKTNQKSFKIHISLSDDKQAIAFAVIEVL